MRTKYDSVLSYFGEESTMASHEFFETLQAFVDAFVEERSAAERFRQNEARKSSAAAAQSAAAASRQNRSVTLNVSYDE